MCILTDSGNNGIGTGSSTEPVNKAEVVGGGRKQSRQDRTGQDSRTRGISFVIVRICAAEVVKRARQEQRV